MLRLTALVSVDVVGIDDLFIHDDLLEIIDGCFVRLRVG